MDSKVLAGVHEELRRRLLSLIDSLSGLRSLTSLESGLHEEGDLLGQALEILVENQDLERCSVYLLAGDQLFCAAGRSWEDKLRPQASAPRRSHVFRLGEGIAGRAAASREVIHCENASLDDRFIPLEQVEGGEPGSVLCVPLIADGEVLGVLNASHPQPGFFHPWHSNILLIYANVLGQMLRYHRLLEQTEQEVRRRTAQLEQALREAQELKQRYEQLSVIDELTKLHNRRFFFPEAGAELSRALRNQESFSIMLIDIDHFKRINDTFGHSVGDEVLRDMAGSLSGQVRDGDILARFGGEEFVLALPNTHAEGARQLSQRIRDAVQALPWDVNGHALSITLSIGISCLPVEPVGTKSILDRLLEQADLALYYCKQHGRNQVHVYHELPEADRDSLVL